MLIQASSRILRHACVANLLGAIALLCHAQAAPANRCKYEDLGHLPLQYHGNALSVVTDGEINGTPAKLLVDTGAGTLLTRFGVERRQLRMDPGAGWGSGVGGETRFYSVPIRSFSVGPIKSSGRGVLRMIDQTGARPEFDAIVGASFLLQRDLELSLADKRIRFFKPDNCRDAFLAYWDANAVQLPLELGRDGARPVMQVQIDGVTFRALIDTGASGSMITMEAVRKLGLSAESAGMTPATDSSGIGAALVRNYRYRFKAFTIGHETIQNPEIRVATTKLDVDMLLGNDFMRTHRILLAPSQGKIYLSYIGGTPFSSGGLEEWVIREAEAGNGHAQLRVGLSRAREKKLDESRAWIDKAVAQATPAALRYRAGELQKTGDAGAAGAAVPLLEKAIAADPFDLAAQLQLFHARMQAGQKESAVTELASVLKRQRDDRWPVPLVEHHLGKIDADQLLKLAAEDKPLARRRRCETYHYLGQLATVGADSAAQAQWKARREAECRGSLAAEL